MSEIAIAANWPKPNAYSTAATIDANQTTQPTVKADSTDNTRLANVYVPPDWGNLEETSAKLSAVSKAIAPFRAKATIALGPVAAKAAPANARIPPPTIAPTPTPTAPGKPIWRSKCVSLLTQFPFCSCSATIPRRQAHASYPAGLAGRSPLPCDRPSPGRRQFSPRTGPRAGRIRCHW